MSTNRTQPWTLPELITEAKRVHAGALSVIGHAPALGRGRHELVYEAEALGAIVAVLESYPLAAKAEAAVNAVLGDLSMRQGFNDLILRDDFREVRRFIIELVGRTVVGPINPFPSRFDRMVAATTPEELSFDEPPAPLAGDLDFA